MKNGMRLYSKRKNIQRMRKNKYESYSYSTMAMQLILNQWIQGSNPCGSTNGDVVQWQTCYTKDVVPQGIRVQISSSPSIYVVRGEMVYALGCGPSFISNEVQVQVLSIHPFGTVAEMDQHLTENQDRLDRYQPVPPYREVVQRQHWALQKLKLGFESLLPCYSSSAMCRRSGA